VCFVAVPLHTYTRQLLYNIEYLFKQHVTDVHVTELRAVIKTMIQKVKFRLKNIRADNHDNVQKRP